MSLESFRVPESKKVLKKKKINGDMSKDHRSQLKEFLMAKPGAI